MIDIVDFQYIFISVLLLICLKEFLTNIESLIIRNRFQSANVVLINIYLAHMSILIKLLINK